MIKKGMSLLILGSFVVMMVFASVQDKTIEVEAVELKEEATIEKEPVVVVKNYTDVLSESEENEKESEENTEEILVKVVNDSDVEWLAKVMYCENGISSDEALLLTGIVVMKRVKSSKFPDSIEGVVTDKRYGIQYACYYNGAWQKYEPDERALTMAREILVEELEKDYPDGLVFQSEFKQGKYVYKHIGNQYFCGI